MYTLYEPHIQPRAVACYCYQIQANQQKLRLCCLYQHQSTVILRRLNKLTTRTTLNLNVISLAMNYYFLYRKITIGYKLG